MWPRVRGCARHASPRPRPAPSSHAFPGTSSSRSPSCFSSLSPSFSSLASPAASSSYVAGEYWRHLEDNDLASPFPHTSLSVRERVRVLRKVRKLLQSGLGSGAGDGRAVAEGVGDGGSGGGIRQLLTEKMMREVRAYSTAKQKNAPNTTSTPFYSLSNYPPWRNTRRRAWWQGSCGTRWARRC
jgi:hypothetical protein